jgi:hypothetical protein
MEPDVRSTVGDVALEDDPEAEVLVQRDVARLRGGAGGVIPEVFHYSERPSQIVEHGCNNPSA